MTITGKIAFLLLILWVIVTGEFFILGIWTFLEVLYSLAFVKTVITVVKYLPQVYMNYTRKSTMGWSIWMVLGVSKYLIEGCDNIIIGFYWKYIFHCTINSG